MLSNKYIKNKTIKIWGATIVNVSPIMKLPLVKIKIKNKKLHLLENPITKNENIKSKGCPN
jgi:hypothetical protein